MILVTGGTGFLGSHLVKKLLERYKKQKIRTISRSEYEIQKLKWQSDNSRLETMFGDIRDERAVEFALRDIDTVFHLAAMKHIEICENNPLDAVTTNVNGTINLLRYFAGSIFIGMSTDKASDPNGCYGVTKLLQEKLILQHAKTAKKQRFMIVRSGNIFASRGSVIDRWIKQLQEINEILVTDLRMTRYFIDVDVLTDAMLNVLEKGKNGRIYIPPQRCIVLSDMVQAFIEIWGNKDTKVKKIGLREGEKLHETLYTPDKALVTEMENKSSEDAEKISIAEIKKLLQKAKVRV
ncbi:MAG: polysaccharide biosynthesis protein [Dehalococcoidales bacterium]